jgi:hypothetical protein
VVQVDWKLKKKGKAMGSGLFEHAAKERKLSSYGILAEFC